MQAFLANIRFCTSIATWKYTSSLPCYHCLDIISTDFSFCSLDAKNRIGKAVFGTQFNYYTCSCLSEHFTLCC